MTQYDALLCVYTPVMIKRFFSSKYASCTKFLVNETKYLYGHRGGLHVDVALPPAVVQLSVRIVLMVGNYCQ